MTADPPARLDGIQALRGLAALAVAIAHIDSLDARFLGGDVMAEWARLGFAGVDLFFVISGFVMVHTTLGTPRGPRAAAAFLATRAVRIYSLWWLVLVPVAAVWMVRPEWVFASIGQSPDLLRSFLLWPDTREPLLAVGWTLVHEMWFYVVFAVLLVLPRVLLPVGLALWAAAVGAMVLLGIGQGSGSPELRVVASALTFEFLLGCLAAWLARTRLVFALAPWLLVAAVAAFVTAGALHAGAPDAAFTDTLKRVAWFGGASFLLVLAVGAIDLRGRLRAARPLVALGDWSYALYLVHVPVFAALARLAAPFALPGGIDNPGWWALMLAVAIAVSWAIHRLFERPVLRAWSGVRRAIAGTPSPGATA